MHVPHRRAEAGRARVELQAKPRIETSIPELLPGSTLLNFSPVLVSVKLETTGSAIPFNIRFRNSGSAPLRHPRVLITVPDSISVTVSTNGEREEHITKGQRRFQIRLPTDFEPYDVVEHYYPVPIMFRRLPH